MDWNAATEELVAIEADQRRRRDEAKREYDALERALRESSGHIRQRCRAIVTLDLSPSATVAERCLRNAKEEEMERRADYT